jgi:hypothetical protein
MSNGIVGAHNNKTTPREDILEKERNHWPPSLNISLTKPSRKLEKYLVG